MERVGDEEVRKVRQTDEEEARVLQEGGGVSGSSTDEGRVYLEVSTQLVSSNEGAAKFQMEVDGGAAPVVREESDIGQKKGEERSDFPCKENKESSDAKKKRSVTFKRRLRDLKESLDEKDIPQSFTRKRGAENGCREGDVQKKLKAGEDSMEVEVQEDLTELAGLRGQPCLPK